MDILACPGCRQFKDGHLDVRTLDREPGAPDVGPLDDDILACVCGRRFPVLGGVPIVFADPAAFAPDHFSLCARDDLAPELAQLLVEPGSDTTPLAAVLEHLSIYLDAHWGAYAMPPPDGPGAVPFTSSAIYDRLAARAQHRVARAVELGCSAGGALAALAAGADHVVGVDFRPDVLRRARQLLAGRPLRYARRMAGRHYQPATITPPAAVANVSLVCADAADPPLVAGLYQRVVALNVIDAVHAPLQLLVVMDGLCAPGGELILTSPYSWQPIHGDGARLGGADPAAAVRELLATGRGLSAAYTIEDEADLPWTLRRDSRSATTYCIHYIRARKG